MHTDSQLTVLEICAGAGGQAIGLERAGFAHALAVEIDKDAADTLRFNRPEWDVDNRDVRDIDGRAFSGVDLLAGGVPCPPFSIAGKQLGADDERDLFPEALRLIKEAKPRAVMLENVRGLASARFAPYRSSVIAALHDLGYEADWRLFNSSSFGVPQLRPRFILVALDKSHADNFDWPVATERAPSVGEVLLPLMKAHGWKRAEEWAKSAAGIAPTIVGGSKKHGGPDLGPTRAKASWLALGVDAKGIADAPPHTDTPSDHVPRLTNEMVARIQGFPPEWEFVGRKTSVYRQIGNAFPPPVAAAIGSSIATALGAGKTSLSLGIPEIDQRLESLEYAS